MALTLEKANRTLSEVEGAKAPAKVAQGGGDSEIKDMLAQVDLLSTIERDTGEQGHRSGKWVYFRGKCPVCGHNDCFRFVPDTNSWVCEGASNVSGYEGGTFLEYVKATGKAANDSEAVTMLREATGNPRPKTSATEQESAKGTATADNPAEGFPPIVGVNVANPPKRAPELVSGLLRAGHKLYVSSASKAGKTWLSIELAICIATGRAWLNPAWRCRQGRVLYVDFELDPPSFDNRVHTVAYAMGASYDEVEANIKACHVRGKAMGTEATGRALCAMVERGAYDLIILDPIYKMMDGDENSAHDVRMFWNVVDRIAGSTGAAILCVHHHSKGGKGDTSAIDRGSGSGVFARDPDAVIDLVEVFPPEDAPNMLSEDQHAFRVSCGGLREFPSFAPFPTVFDYPTHKPGGEFGVTSDWKPHSAQRKGGKSSGDKRKLKKELELHKCEAVILKTLEECGEDHMTASDAAECTGISKNTLKNRLEDSEILRYESRGAGKAALIVRTFEPMPVQTELPTDQEDE